jgi:hypothetical protein
MTETSSPPDGGYITHLPWHRHYVPALNPNLIRFQTIVAGLEPPRLGRVCELAYGQGVSLAIHAACNQGIAWTGTDMNVEHATFARRLAKGHLPNLALYDEPFSVFCRRTDVGRFDLVGMTGTWSWLPEADRVHVRHFLGERLSPRGMFLVDYMTLPGQYDVTGLRHLLAQMAAGVSQSRQDTSARVSAALNQAERLLDLQPAAFRSTESIRRLLTRMRETRPEFIEHEYLNHHWRPEYFDEMARTMNGAGLRWACSGDIGEHAGDLHLAPRQQEFLATIADPELRESARDLLINRSGRQDLWAAARTTLSDADREGMLRAERVVLVRPAGEFAYAAQGALGEVALAKAIYAPLLALLADHRPRTLDELAQSSGGGSEFSGLVDCVVVLIASGVLQVCSSSRQDAERSADACRALNSALLDDIDGTAIEWLGSPVTGGGIAAPRLDQLLLSGLSQGASTADELAAFAAPRIPPRNSEERRQDPAELGRNAEDFLRRRLSIYRALQVAAV